MTSELCRCCERPVRCPGSLFCRRGMCRRCYLKSELRVRFPAVIPDPYLIPPLPSEPTDHPPGSPGKIQAMMDRFERGEQVHHPADNKPWQTPKSAYDGWL